MSITTTLATGEEDPTTLRIGEETIASTDALGEEGTTVPIGEETATTEAVGEEDPLTGIIGEDASADAATANPFGAF